MRSGNADLIASRTPVRSAVQVHCVPGENDFLKEVTDSSAVVSELGALLTRRNAGRPCHVPRTADVDGELLFPSAGANPRFCCDRAAPGGGNDRLPGVGPDLRLRCDFAAPAVSAAFSSSTRTCRSCWLCCGSLWCGSSFSTSTRLCSLHGQELVLAFATFAQPLLGVPDLCGQVDDDKDVFSSCFRQGLSPIDRHRLVSDVIHGRCTSSAPVHTNSCGRWAWELIGGCAR